MPSAERSEAREDDVPRLLMFRVASPLVMATCGRGARRNDVPWVLRLYSCLSPLPPAAQGGSATRNDQRRLRRLLRLRCAPPSETFDVIHTRASESEASCERSSMTHFSPPRFIRGEACQSEGAARAALERSKLERENRIDDLREDALLGGVAQFARREFLHNSVSNTLRKHLVVPVNIFRSANA